MKTRTILIPFCLFVVSCAANTSGGNKDDYIWLEDSASERTKSWIAKTNKNTLEILDTPVFHEIKESRMKRGKTARVEQVFYLGKMLAKISQPTAKSKGILQVATPSESYSTLKWNNLIDFDELGQKEGVRWEYDKSICNPDNLNICMVGISNDGENKVEYREFNIEKGNFVKDGLFVPTGITNLLWADSDSLLLTSTSYSKSISKSGKSTELRKLNRGQSIKEAELILARDAIGGIELHNYSHEDKNYRLAHHWHDFYNGNTWIYEKDQLIKIDIPTGHRLYGIHNGNIILKTYAEWNVNNESYPAGSVLSIDLAKSLVGDIEIELLFKQTEKQSFEHIYLTKSRIVLNVLSELRTYPLSIYQDNSGKWVKERVKKPSSDVLRINSASNYHDEAIVSYRGFLTASAYYFMDAKNKTHRPAAASEKTFPTEKYKVEYRFSKGEDGVKIPYQIVFPKDMDKTKAYPTIIYVYAAYGLPRTEFYSDVIGNEWLERGGVYVIANARGGGAYGDKWHKAAMRTTKHKTYEDVATVAKDLIDKGITTPSKLGVYGGSLGGLASCSVAVNYPELFSASVCKSPLLDLIRFTELGDGNSWISELGDPSDAAERPYLEANSPYNKIETVKDLHVPLLVTYSKDDIMHPGHARKMKAKMDDLNIQSLYYEHPEGGHSGPKSREGKATVTAVQYSYFVNKLMKPKEVK
jgi:prolyl oligopeptidase